MLLCFVFYFLLPAVAGPFTWDKGKKKYYQNVTVTLLGLFPSTPNIL